MLCTQYKDVKKNVFVREQISQNNVAVTGYFLNRRAELIYFTRF